MKEEKSELENEKGKYDKDVDNKITKDTKGSEINKNLGKDVKIDDKQINDIDIISEESKKNIKVTNEKVENNKKINEANNNKKDKNPKMKDIKESEGDDTKKEI